MNGIVTRVYEDDQHYHMVFKNSSSTKGNSTDDEEKQRALGGEFRLQKRDLYKERIEQDAIERAALLQKQNQNSEQSGSNDQNQIHNFLQEVDQDPDEFINLAVALDLDEKEMEEEARIRLAEEGHLNLAVK